MGVMAKDRHLAGAPRGRSSPPGRCRYHGPDPWPKHPL